MKIAVLLLGALVSTALADHRDDPTIPNMPDLNKLNNLGGGNLPEIPAGMKIEDLKDAFYSMPPSMKDRLNEMAQSFGMQLDDVEDALNNPPQKLKEYFEKNAGESRDGTFQVPTGDGDAPTDGLDMGSLLENMDLGAMGNMLKGMDIEGMMKNMDLGVVGDMMKNVDISSIMQNMDLGAMGDIVKNVDIEGLMKNMDLEAMSGMMKNMDIGSMMKNIDMGAIGDIAKNVDIGGMMKNMDIGPMGDIMKNVDIGGLMKNMDLGAMRDIMKNVDIGGMMQNMDLGPMGDIMKNVDIGGMMKNMDLGGMMKNMDLGAMSGLLKNVDIGSMMKTMNLGGMMKNMDLGAMSGLLKNVDMGAMTGLMKNMDLGAITGMMKNLDLGSITSIMRTFDLRSITSLIGGGRFDLDRLLDLKDLAWEYLESAGLPTDDPMDFMNFLHKKLKSMPLPPGLDATTIMNMVHGQLESMGFPEDSSKVKGWLLDQAGLIGIKDIEELKDPDVLSQVMIKKAFRMLGINEDEDPTVVKDRILEQLTEEANKLGASITKNSTPEELMKEMDKVLTKELNDMVGIKADSFKTGSIHRAAMNKLQGMGIPINDFGAMKRIVMNKVMKQLMKSVTPMIMNFFLPRPQQQRPMMPPMMPRRPPMMPINLDVSVNVEQPESRMGMMMPMPMMMPRYLHGAEQAMEHPKLDDLSEEEMFHHIMAVRHGLMTGEMPEEVLQEMIEDLMTARLKTRVLTVRNMFLQDRLNAMEREMDMMQGRPEPQAIRRRPSRRHRDPNHSPLLRALMKPRVV